MEDDLEFTTKSLSSDAAPKFSHGRGDIVPGTVVAGRYKVVQKIGEGGMAVVYRIEQIFLREIMALKVLTTGLSDTAIVRFQKEAQVCRKLDHPNLIRVFDFALLENESPYLVMEFINGESLADILKRQGQLSESEAIAIFIQIMDGLAYAHDQGVIHRDIKPSNVMICDRADNQLQVKILDFGIAKITGKDTLNTMTLTGTGEIFGSPLFMSPEQCLGRTVDLRSDLYSIGCALYQVLTGAPPFAGESALSTMMMHLEQEPLPLKQASLGKVFSPGIEKVTMKLLEKLPENRYQLAADVRDDLIAVKERRAPQKPQPRLQSVEMKARVSPAVLAMIAVCVILATGSIAVLTLTKNKSSQNTVPVSAEANQTIGGTSASNIVSASEASKPVEPFFAAVPLKDWKSGPWTLNFPSNELGAVALADKQNNVEFELLHTVAAQGLVAFPAAGPLIFSTHLVEMKPSELFRFRPDEIQQLALLDDKIHDQTIADIAYFRNLRALDLDNCLALTGNCLNSIAKLRNLVYLRMQTPYVDIDLARLGQIVANSRIETFAGGFFDGTDSFCHEISGAKNIVNLKFQKCDLTDTGVFDISKMPNLQILDIEDCGLITKAGMEKLSDVRSLKALLLWPTRVKADSIPAFKKLPHGCRLVIDTSLWAPADQQLFKETFPNGKVP
ncbi:MAG: serine/threonine-protein kinase [Candidatus Obscuribacterales bacterium]|nr:serine/threonine-protein kinase [Candidatus Obscuribacterales bacterium]